MVSTGATVSQGTSGQATGAGNAQQGQAGQGKSPAPSTPNILNSKPAASKGNPLTQAANAVEGESSEQSLGDEIESGSDTELTDEEIDAIGEDGESKKNEQTEEPDAPKKDDDGLDPNKKFKIKVKGQDVEVTGEQLKKLAEQGGRMYQAMEEAAKYRKENESLVAQTQDFSTLFQKVKASKEDYIELGRALGHDVEAIAHDIVVDRMRYEGMDDFQRRAYDTDKELKTYKEREAKELEERQRHAHEQKLRQSTEAVQTEVMEFFQQQFGGRPNLDALERTLVQVLGSYRSDGQGGYTRMPVAKAFELIQNQFKANKQKTLRELSPDEIKTLPDDHPLMIEARQRAIQKFKQSRQSGAPERKAPEQSASQPRRPGPVAIDDWFKKKEEQYNRSK